MFNWKILVLLASRAPLPLSVINGYVDYNSFDEL